MMRTAQCPWTKNALSKQHKVLSQQLLQTWIVWFLSFLLLYKCAYLLWCGMISDEHGIVLFCCTLPDLSPCLLQIDLMVRHPTDFADNAAP